MRFFGINGGGEVLSNYFLNKLETGDHPQRRRKITRDTSEPDILDMPPDGLLSPTSMSNNHRWMLYKMSQQQQQAGTQQSNIGQPQFATSSVIARLEPEVSNANAQDAGK